MPPIKDTINKLHFKSVNENKCVVTVMIENRAFCDILKLFYDN